MEDTKHDLSWLAGQSDEALLLSFRLAPNQKVETELIRRHWAWIDHYIRKHAGGAGVAASDVEDVAQDAFLAFHHALSNYGSTQPRKTGSCKFRSYLRYVLHGTLVDAGRRQRREDNHREPSVDASSLLESESIRVTRVIDCPSFEDPTQGDPALLAEARENWDRLEMRVDEFGDGGRQVWDCLVRQERLLDLAHKLRVSRWAIKRLKKRLIDWLKQWAIFWNC